MRNNQVNKRPKIDCLKTKLFFTKSWNKSWQDEYNFPVFRPNTGKLFSATVLQVYIGPLLSGVMSY